MDISGLDISNNLVVSGNVNISNHLDVSGIDISNNLNVEGLLHLGTSDTSDISGSLRYTDISKVEVWYDNKWNELGGGGGVNGIWSNDVDGKVRLTYSDYYKPIDISGLDISNNLVIASDHGLYMDIDPETTKLAVNGVLALGYGSDTYPIPPNNSDINSFIYCSDILFVYHPFNMNGNLILQSRPITNCDIICYRFTTCDKNGNRSRWKRRHWDD